jgi:hypothetical protein
MWQAGSPQRIQTVKTMEMEGMAGASQQGSPGMRPRRGSDGGSPFSNAIKSVSCASLSHLNSLRQVIQNTHRTASGRPLSRKRSERERRGGVTAVLPSVSLCEFCSSGAALLPAPPACLQESTGAGRAFFFHPSTLPQCSKFRQPTSLPLFTSPAPRQAGCASFRFLPGLCSLCFSAAKQTCFRRFGLRCA